jgi:bisphosphoglycerate-dependent phosphoglycerate mutase
LIATIATTFRTLLSIQVCEEAFTDFNWSTLIPIIYELDNNMKPIKKMKLLGDEKTIHKSMKTVQGKVKI